MNLDDIKKLLGQVAQTAEQAVRSSNPFHPQEAEAAGQYGPPVITEVRTPGRIYLPNGQPWAGSDADQFNTLLQGGSLNTDAKMAQYTNLSRKLTDAMRANLATQPALTPTEQNFRNSHLFDPNFIHPFNPTGDNYPQSAGYVNPVFARNATSMADFQQPAATPPAWWDPQNPPITTRADGSVLQYDPFTGAVGIRTPGS